MHPMRHGRHRQHVWIAAAIVVASAATLFADEAELARDLARVRAYEHARVRLIGECRPATACMFDKGSRAGGGSGVVIDAEGYGLTNFHVVAGMLKDRVGEAGFDDGKLYEFDVLGIDPTGDVAMFRLTDRTDQKFAPLGDSDGLRVGDFTLAMGNPFLLAEDYIPTVTFGIISGLHRYQAGAGEGGRALRYTDCIQVDTSINPGNSGGPLFDLSGRIIGINGRISLEERGRVNIGVGYAISINQIKRFIPAWRAGVTMKHASAGFTVRDRDGGIIVDQILDDSPAYLAGLRLSDRIEEFAGRTMISANQFGSYLGVFPEKWPVVVKVKRGEADLEMSFRLEDMPLPNTQGMGGDDPFAPHPVTQKANARAVDRLIRRHCEFSGGQALLRSAKRIRFAGIREFADPGRETVRLDFDEKRSEATKLSDTATPADIEQAIRWMLISNPSEDQRSSFRVVSSDEVSGRICAVVRGDPAGFPEISLWLDDDDGRLMRLAFKDRLTGREVRYEYDDFKKDDGFRFPSRRVIIFDDRPYATETMDSIEVLG